MFRRPQYGVPFGLHHAGESLVPKPARNHAEEDDWLTFIVAALWLIASGTLELLCD